MADSGQIRMAFTKLSENGEEIYAKICEVLAIDTGARTVDVKPVDDTAEIFNVPLQADTQGNGLVLFPRAGSKVLVSFTSKHTAAVVMYSEVDKVLLRIDSSSVEITGSGIVINGGDLGGLVKLQELKDNLDSLKSYVEAMNSALPTAFNAIGASTAANGALGATSYQGAMAGQTIQIKDMENDKIKQ